jgi:hypothetical protein
MSSARLSENSPKETASSSPHFFEQRPHRMACAKCDFYMPKLSTAALLLEGKQSLLRLLQEIPRGDAEQAAVEDGVAAYESFC